MWSRNLPTVCAHSTCHIVIHHFTNSTKRKHVFHLPHYLKISIMFTQTKVATPWRTPCVHMNRLNLMLNHDSSTAFKQKTKWTEYCVIYSNQVFGMQIAWVMLMQIQEFSQDWQESQALSKKKKHSLNSIS